MAGALHRFEGWTALVTGASSGLGAEFARQLAPVAGKLIHVARRGEVLQKLAAELQLQRPGLAVEVEAADLSRPEEVTALVARLNARGIAPDLLVNNAGLGDIGLFENTDDARLASMIEVNIHALTQLTRAWLPGMIARGKGSVVNVGSTAGYLPLPTFAVYAASKAYVNSFSEALFWEVRGTGVTVTAVCPGPVPTGFSATAHRDKGAKAMKSPAFVRVEAAQAVAESLRAAARGRPRIVPGARMRIASLVLTATPLWTQRILFRRTALPEIRRQRRNKA